MLVLFKILIFFHQKVQVRGEVASFSVVYITKMQKHMLLPILVFDILRKGEGSPPLHSKIRCSMQSTSPFQAMQTQHIIIPKQLLQMFLCPPMNDFSTVSNYKITNIFRFRQTNFNISITLHRIASSIVSNPASSLGHSL